MNHLAQIQAEFIKLNADDLSGSLHKEREHRIKLKELPPECSNMECSLIKQGIVKEVKDGDNVISYIRIRMKQDPGEEPKYSLGVKHFPLKQEAEAEISKDIFDNFYPDNLSKPQEKNRYTLKNGWEIDEIDDNDITAEYEYKNGETIRVPRDWQQLIK